MEENVAATARFLSTLTTSLAQYGIKNPSEADLYLAYNQGARGAAALLNAPPTDSAVSVINSVNPGAGLQSVKQNGGTANMTAQQFIAHIENTFNAKASKTPAP